MSGKINEISGLGEVVYKLCLGLIIAALMVALYFHNESRIERMAESARARQAERSGQAVAGTEDDGPTAGDAGAVAADNGAETARSSGLTLYGRDGAETEFSSFRGEIVFLTFWTPRDAPAVADMAAAANELTAAAAQAAGGVPVRLLWVLTPDRASTGGAAASDGTAAAALPEDLATVYEGLGGAADTVAGHFVDGDARLARTFLVETYPSTYVFDADGGLCDYKTGTLDADRMIEMAEDAAGGNG